MKTSDNGINIIKAFEEFRSSQYLCQAGKPTIGYGHVITGGGTMSPLTEEGATNLLKEDLKRFETVVNNVIHKIALNQNQFDALVSLAYNIGVFSFNGSTLAEMVNQGSLVMAAEQFIRWDKIHDPKTGALVISNGLHIRRLKEKVLFLS